MQIATNRWTNRRADFSLESIYNFTFNDIRMKGKKDKHVHAIYMEVLDKS